MGDNRSFTIMEHTVIGVYNYLGKMDKDLLDVLMAPYARTDIDSGGRYGLLTHDGKDIEQVVIETCGGIMPEPPPFPRPEWRTDDWTQEKQDAWDNYYDDIYCLFHDIVRREWNW